MSIWGSRREICGNDARALGGCVRLRGELELGPDTVRAGRLRTIVPLAEQQRAAALLVRAARRPYFRRDVPSPKMAA